MIALRRRRPAVRVAQLTGHRTRFAPYRVGRRRRVADWFDGTAGEGTFAAVWSDHVFLFGRSVFTNSLMVERVGVDYSAYYLGADGYGFVVARDGAIVRRRMGGDAAPFRERCLQVDEGEPMADELDVVREAAARFGIGADAATIEWFSPACDRGAQVPAVDHRALARHIVPALLASETGLPVADRPADFAGARLSRVTDGIRRRVRRRLSRAADPSPY